MEKNENLPNLPAEFNGKELKLENSKIAKKFNNTCQSNAGLESILKEGWAAIHEGNHLSEAYRHRAIQITKWRRLRDFINLGVAPSLILATSVGDNYWLRNILLAISALCSISSWTWVIFGFSYNWENQLKLSIDIPSELRLIVSEIKEEIEIFVNAKQNQNDLILEQTASKIKKLIRQVHSARSKIEYQQVYVAPWMNLMAQQNTMRLHNAKCGSCGHEWIIGSKIFNSDEAREFIKKAKQKKIQGICADCGQKHSNPT